MSETVVSQDTDTEPVVDPRDLHFELSFLGEPHLTSDYTLRWAGRSYPLDRHTPQTLRRAGLEGATPPTHVARDVRSTAGVVGLLQVLGPPDATGFPTLALLAVGAPEKTSFTSADIAQAVVFLNPSVTVLTPGTADTVLQHIAGSDALPGMTFAIETAQSTWNVPRPVVDADGRPVRKPDGTQYHTYELDPTVENSAVPVSGQATSAIYSDDTLSGSRWNLLPGVAHLDMTNESSSRSLAAANDSGYRISLVDGGPNFGVSVAVNGLSDDFVLDLTVTNSYVRHLSVFVSFLEGDGRTAMVVDDNIWTQLMKGAMLPIVQAWLNLFDSEVGEELRKMLESHDNTLKFCGTVGAEGTFLGIPVSTTAKNFTFALPSDAPVGTVRLLAGSLGTSSGLDWDPTAAWLGLSMTALIDLVVPTYALISTAGEESNTLFEQIFESVPFLGATAVSVFTVAKDIFDDPANTGSDLKAGLISFADSLVTKVLTSSDVAAKLAVYFGAEEVEEAIPYVGWALKALAMGAAAAQLAQTIGEVVASPRVVEFDLKVTMDAVITLTPDSSTGSEFPATATSVHLTAQYSDNTTRTYQADVDPAKARSLTIDWHDIPVGGHVTFVVAMFSAEGWGVGKGQSATILNEITKGQHALTVAITVQQLLYPIDADTTFRHHQLLGYDAGYAWRETADAPTDTAESLGTGPSGHHLEALAGITLSDDLGILGYSWEASGLDLPPVDSGQVATELYTMQNIGFRRAAGDDARTWPEAGYMTAPAGYAKAPLLLYLRTAAGGAESLAGPGFFFLDPTGDPETGFHLRQVAPVISDSVPIGDPSRRFDLAQGTSWGRFASLPTSLAIHSNGYVVGVDPAYDNLQIVKLAALGTPDAQAPWANIPLGPGTGPGRLAAPALTCIRPDQTILVLEAGNHRVQAFSRGGHPVPAFAPSPTPYWFPLVSHAAADVDVVYLSLSVDVAGYAYLLSQNGNGYDPVDFHLDVYTPTGQHLLHQPGLVAAGLDVDLWRNVYTLNFQRIAGPGGRTEPSLSAYLPTTPKARPHEETRR